MCRAVSGRPAQSDLKRSTASNPADRTATRSSTEGWQVGRIHSERFISTTTELSVAPAGPATPEADECDAPAEAPGVMTAEASPDAEHAGSSGFNTLSSIVPAVGPADGPADGTAAAAGAAGSARCIAAAVTTATGSRRLVCPHRAGLTTRTMLEDGMLAACSIVVWLPRSTSLCALGTTFSKKAESSRLIGLLRRARMLRIAHSGQMTTTMEIIRISAR
mmetsp:Transcript_36636/g.91360  ORF Transcript_36636/g.91360 Transcript_36636/m.91360 type:complete len:220 (+) Transcript_36636:182-841(+)